MISSIAITFEAWGESSSAVLSSCVLSMHNMINAMLYIRAQNLFFWKPKHCIAALRNLFAKVWEKVVTEAAVTESHTGLCLPSCLSGGLSNSEQRQGVFTLLRNHTLPQEQILSLKTQGPVTGLRFQSLACHPLREEIGSFPVLCHWEKLLKAMPCHWGAWDTDTEPRRFWPGQVVQVCFWWLEYKSPLLPSSTFLHPCYSVVIFLGFICLCISTLLLELNI